MNIYKVFTADKLITATEANDTAEKNDELRIGHDLGIVDEVVRKRCKEGFYDAYIDPTSFQCFCRIKDILTSKGYEVQEHAHIGDFSDIVYISWNKHELEDNSIFTLLFKKRRS